MTTKKSTPNPNKNPDPKKTVPPFDFKEYEKLKSLYSNVSLLMGCLQETKEKIAIDPEKADIKELSNVIYYIISALDSTIVNHSKNSTDLKGLKFLYGEIYTRLLERIVGLCEDYTNRCNIIKAKLEQLEEDKRKYVDFQFKGMQEVTEDREDKEWEHGEPSFDDIIRKLISSGLGIKFPAGKHAMIIDGNGCYFK